MAKRKGAPMKPTRLFKKAKKEVATKSYVRKAIAASKQVGRKAFALDEQALSTVAQGSFLDPLQITQGDSIHHRHGDTIYVRGIRIRGLFHNNASIVNTVRMCVLQTDEDADFTAATGLFDSNVGTADFSGITGLNAMYQEFEPQKVKAKLDRIITLGTSSATDGSQVRYFDEYIKFPGRGLKVRFVGTAAGAANVFPRIHIGFWAAEAPDDTSLGETVEVSMRALTYFTN